MSRLGNMLDLIRPFEELHRQMDQLFEDFGSWFGDSAAESALFPAVNIWEDGDNVYAEAEIPGVETADLEVFTEGNQLTIRGRRQSQSEQNATWLRQERVAGEFSRVIALPVEVNADKVEATLKNGMLTVHMPKSEAARARRIEVKTT